MSQSEDTAQAEDPADEKPASGVDPKATHVAIQFDIIEFICIRFYFRWFFL